MPDKVWLFYIRSGDTKPEITGPYNGVLDPDISARLEVVAKDYDDNDSVFLVRVKDGVPVASSIGRLSRILESADDESED